MDCRAGRAAELGRIRGFGVLVAYSWLVGDDPNAAVSLLLSAKHFWTPQQRETLRKAAILDEDRPPLFPTPPMLFAATWWYCGTLTSAERDAICGAGLDCLGGLNDAAPAGHLNRESMRRIAGACDVTVHELAKRKGAQDGG